MTTDRGGGVVMTPDDPLVEASQLAAALEYEVRAACVALATHVDPIDASRVERDLDRWAQRLGEIVDALNAARLPGVPIRADGAVTGRQED